jgi:hypothetical protein
MSESWNGSATWYFRGSEGVAQRLVPPAPVELYQQSPVCWAFFSVLSRYNSGQMDPEERLTVSKALAIAEQCVEDAKRAREAGEPDGEEWFQEWSATLFCLRMMKERDVPERLRDE